MSDRMIGEEYPYCETPEAARARRRDEIVERVCAVAFFVLLLGSYPALLVWAHTQIA